ncbi:MAG: rRNA methylase [Alphaproteobacteria bacterium]|nr:rRNA methylase [Alphaproteobacteria bacterium]
MAGLIFTALVMEFSTIRAGVVDLMARVRNVESLELPSLKMAFRSPEAASVIPWFEGLSEDKKTMLTDDIRALKAEWLERLLNVGALRNLCEYVSPTPDMREKVAMDYKLEAMGLIEIQPSPEVEAAAMRDMRQSLAENAAGWTIGKPVSCYVATLKDRGWLVKTAVLQYLAAGLANVGGSKADARSQRKEMRMARSDIR